jgi:RimJ/RimL family protein N-acetyltransferase
MTTEISLREVLNEDLPIFFEHQRDPEATCMAGFAARDYESFMTHWAKCLADETTILMTIVFDGNVAGNIVCWEQVGKRNVGYWLGREFWGRGIASMALRQFLEHITSRPLYAYVGKSNTASIHVLHNCGFKFLGEQTFSHESRMDLELIMEFSAQNSLH